MKSNIIAPATMAVIALCVSTYAKADDWRKDYPKVNFASNPNENEADQATRLQPVIDYLQKKLKVEFVGRRTSDYAGIVEALRGNRIQLARIGTAAYAQAYIVTNGGVDLLAAESDDTGTVGYRSVVIVRSDSPYKTIKDLAGKSIAFGDPGSASGYQVPRYFLKEEGVVADSFFGKTSFSGSHENTVIGVLSGTFDAGATWYSSEARSNMARMEHKNMIRKGLWRIVWTSPQIPTSPWVVPSKLPKEMKDDIKNALLAMATEDPAAWQALTDGNAQSLKPVTHQDYEAVVRLTRENLKDRRKQ